MRVIVNGQATETGAADLAALVGEFGHEAALVATAVNEDFVPRAARGDTPLREHDVIEIVSPMQGG